MAYKDFGGWSVRKLALEQSTSERYFYEKALFYGLPLSTTTRFGRYYFGITTLGIDDKVLLTQMRAYDSKRLINKIGVITSEEQEAIKRQFTAIINGIRREKIEPPLVQG